MNFKKSLKLNQKQIIGTGAVLVIIIFLIASQVGPGNGTKTEEIAIDEDTEINYIKKFTECGTEKHYSQEYPPEIFERMDFIGYTEEELTDFLPDDWKLEEFSQESVTLAYYGEKYEKHEEIVEKVNSDFVGYVGIYQNKIAIYRGEPPEGELVEVTRYQVKDVYFNELKEGIKFESEEEKNKILESYTS
ncbi:BofC C-terminal domain-containing protein [Natranaerobius thermophilus]|uniref:Bypass of forespore C C-terminal domain-containing protein n=1 Tax=Natranaerobius thermophilus (strain ATCC BAA-1301 / DSM 18059 / JW/NM-WN-LF) TaxID=457570 RepID=B2A5L7_NATTJ|nr:BofC C-terminal domain-containing protein [Natranaerobius thermophilus]ACB85371.1 hypothetical protein Nther_1799 [Natranaerobius thermophilus JW/NM-WN-LF]